MVIDRELNKQLLDWKNNPSHKALLLDGARQVGKTFSIRRFADENYDVFLEINFIETPSAKAIFEGDLSADNLITGLTAFSNMPLVKGKTLIFLDEIQECPRARTAIKFLVDDGRFDYAESGSLLGVTYRHVDSLPVGYENEIRVFPLTYLEFAKAIGIQTEVLESAKAACSKGKQVNASVHERLKRAFRLYMAVGGMPAVVDQFVETSDIARVLQVQNDILRRYRQDVVKYAPNKAHVNAIFDTIAPELSKRNKRFMLSDLAKTARMERYASDFMWLADAGVALPCYNVCAPTLPLKVNMKHNLFKLFFCDSGLLSAMSAGRVQFDIIEGNINVNQGAHLENTIAQELAANGFNLFYYDKSKIGEVDFLLQEGSRVLPLEAKSGKDFISHKALDNLMGVEEWGLEEAVVLSGENVTIKDNVKYLPWYAVSFLQNWDVGRPMIVENGCHDFCYN